MYGTESLVTDFFFIAESERNDIQRYSSNWERSRIEDFWTGTSNKFIFLIEKKEQKVRLNIHWQRKKLLSFYFLQVANITLYPELFSLENNLLTPTFKNKRPVLRKKFQSVIDDLYAEIEKWNAKWKTKESILYKKLLKF